ncbi:F-box/LRR-repeat protein 12-like isoform X2 [Amphiura filiformis]|uniref:F-box/LRR-repeat protein 12-like isoform X2 n=1 Tax=Amphiura filiformis TaxID=82378 RepID=UPI003B217036
MGQVKSRRRGLTKSKANADDKSNFDKTGKKTKDHPACINDILVDDVLLKIFSFLTVFEKLTVSRTCKRWHNLIKESHLWQTVDFWNSSTLLKDSRSWDIPKEGIDVDAKSALRILQSYTDSLLKRVYLRASNLAVMRYLSNNCPNLQTLSLLSSEQHIPYCDVDINGYFSESNFALPLTLEQLQLSFSAVTLGLSESSEFKMLTMMQFKHTVLPNIIKCQHLRHITLKMCNGISVEDVEILTSGLPKLQEIWMLTFATYPDTTETLEEILRRIVHNLPDLTSLRFMPVNRSFSGYGDYPPSYNIDNLLQDLSKRSHLRELRVRDAMFNPEAFAAMTRAQEKMEELVLWNCDCVTDEIMKIIARDLPSLKILELPFSRPYTDRGLKALNHHPSLHTLNVFRSMLDVSFQALSTEVIFDTLLTLPNLEQAGGLHWQSIDADFPQFVEKLRVTKPNIRIEMS